MSNFVFVLDTNRQPLNPCSPGVARSLLQSGKASVFRHFPFTIILNKSVKSEAQPMEIKLDPGSKTTGIALRQDDKIVFGAELNHRGYSIKQSLESRRALRRGRRNRHYIGRVAVRTTGSFNISTANGLVQGISHKYCSRVHGKDGYQYSF